MEKISDRLWKKSGEAGIPLTAAFELLPLCNLHCKMCYVRKEMSDVVAAGGLLSAEEWIDYAKQGKELGLLFPLLTGGEPFLHPDLCKILSTMEDMGMQVSVNTNGTLIDRDMAKWLGKHRPMRLNVTLYGASEESYEKLCGNGAAYGKLLDAIQYLKEENVPVKFNTSITPDNYHELEAIMAYAKEVESPIQVATYMFPPIRRSMELAGQNHRLSPVQAGEARVKADYLQADKKWFLTQAARFQHFLPPTDEMLMAENPEGMRMTCRAGHCSFWIDWKGNMTNCGMYGSVEVPLKGRTLKEAWNDLRDRTHAFRYYPVCRNCPNLPLCHSCVAMVFNECGTADGRPEYLCEMNASVASFYKEYAFRHYPEEAASIWGNREISNLLPAAGESSCDIEII